ncbi:MAG: CusA/CzcA family heavy metal efflux RND transporter [Candidatus Kapabacteria bacterium]|nr:CusA/CzcA family heavy metal efflux RND transporter [Candidatus Kapabacteria bacterium]
MLDRTILFSIRNKLVIALLTLALIAWGVYSATQLPIDAVPDITNNQVQIITRSPSLGAQEIERLITFPVETALATIPGREEIRSFSRFGLSVVTIVFKEEIDVYWARQQVSERIKEAEQQIPRGIGSPELAPVTTGLGEIYQYVIRAKTGFEATYSPMELRTIQDWTVRRQLLGTEGVADVSSFGGRLKQYEIALNPDRLRAMNISIHEVFTALEQNNQNTGGAYIEKHPQTYFIRSEGLARGTADLEKIVVKTPPQGVPILIRDVATVQLGFAIRYGAMTRVAAATDTSKLHSDGEVVGAVVMMLKGENSSKVIANVKERIKQIEATLPEGVEIVPFLDRTKLVNSAISTVAINLAEGALIVVFVLVLFLGNLRAGLVVASTIPLALLFAIAMMTLFGVSGNLMSLGAIDFGIIVDGAVIIVEATLHHLSERVNTHATAEVQHLSQAEMDSEVYHSASQIRSSAAFGEIIILIVYLPILALVGVEGKMFRPMAQTVSFAILGAFILSLTYIPMMSALFLSKNTAPKENFSDRMMQRFQAWYEPLLRRTLRQKTLVLSTSVVLFLGAVLLFTMLGGEFIPTLDEGDFAVDTRVLTGSSLTHTVETTIKAATLLTKNFPEITQVASKIGSGEIPTDPMAIEAADMMIILKPRSEWTSASTMEELASKMASTLEVFPGVEFGFQQPIQMRFNELMTGGKQDVVLKIYGEDLDALAEEAKRVGKLVSGIEGASDVYIERVTGLPQIIVRPDRDALARYGVSVASVNDAVRAAFAGESAGMIFENERRFDLLVRLDTAQRKRLEDVQNLLVSTPRGNHVPLRELALVKIELGPNQIQREDAKRRIIVGFNVRGRDVEGVVEEVRTAIQQRIKLPTGYFISYGGSFENLQHAKQRLAIAVPLALFLIFTLLYFTFRSVKYSLLIFTAIPLSAIGGVVALWLRGMPFSISAGIGFIALFGVAVLNGIVLVSYFNRLKHEGISDVEDIVLTGTAVRLRPVLMTAAVASLGFLPMALSNSSGAEVQKPLATVVIGGLVSATLLTLIVLPVLYVVVEKWGKRSSPHPNPSPEGRGAFEAQANTPLFVLILLLFGNATMFAQSPNELTPNELPRRTASSPSNGFTLEQAIEIALKNNPSLQAGRTEIELQSALQRTSSDIGKTTVSAMIGQYNSFAQDNSIAVSQAIPFPTVLTSQFALGDAHIRGAELKFAATRNDLLFAVKSAFYQIAVLQERERLLREQDSVLAMFAKAAKVRTNTGETSKLEASAASLQALEVSTILAQTRADILTAQTQLQTLLAVRSSVNSTLSIIAPNPLKRSLQMPLIEGSDSARITQNPLYAFIRQQIAIANAAEAVEAARILPDFSVGYFSQTLIGASENGRIAGANDRFSGVQVGVAVPLWLPPQLAKVESSRLAADLARINAEAVRNQLTGEYAKAVQQYLKFKRSVEFYEQSALPEAAQILDAAQKSYTSGNIGYIEYSQALTRVLAVKTNYADALNAHNHTVLMLEFLAGNP